MAGWLDPRVIASLPHGYAHDPAPIQQAAGPSIRPHELVMTSASSFFFFEVRSSR